jgi:3-dehydroquinate synthetase
VALGMVLAFRYSSNLGYCAATETDRVATHIAGCDLPTRLADVGLAKRGARLTGWMTRDKKNSQGRTALVLARGIGRAFLDPAADLRRLAAFLDHAP